MSNLDPNQSRAVVAELRGVQASGVTGRVLTAPTINGYNSFEQPDVVRPVPFSGAQVAGGRITVTLRARAVIVLEVR